MLSEYRHSRTEARTDNRHDCKTCSWCQPCRMLSPILNKYVEDPSNIDGKEVDLVTVDVDAQQELAAKYQVS